MKPTKFMQWLRDEAKCCPSSKEGKCLGTPSNAELRRWILNGAVLCNGSTLTLESNVDWPIEQLVIFPNNNKSRCTIQ